MKRGIIIIMEGFPYSHSITVYICTRYIYQHSTFANNEYSRGS